MNTQTTDHAPKRVNKTSLYCAFFLIACCAALSACAKIVPGNTFAAAPTPTPILVYGDSLSAGYRVPQTQRWSTLLEAKLHQEGVIRPNQTVANESISGETSSGGLKRFPQALQKHRPKVVVLELGANDGLRRQSMGALKSNLAQMIAQSHAAGARVILVGVKPPLLFSFVGTSSFTDVYEQLADEYDVTFVPDLFTDISSSHMQDDRLHPNASGQPLMMDVVYKAVVAESNK